MSPAEMMSKMMNELLSFKQGFALLYGDGTPSELHARATVGHLDAYYEALKTAYREGKAMSYEAELAAKALKDRGH